MCGIAGVFLLYDQAPSRIARLVAMMLDAQGARGPDGSGVWSSRRLGLGSVRLSVTGDEANGAQPIIDPWGGISVFNGEIYDYAEVLSRHGLPAHSGASDTMALAAAMARNGPDGLADLRGPFAAARYNTDDRSLLLVRDPCGKKPIYLKRIDGGWAFASTLHALHAAAGPLALRQGAVEEYLMFRSVGGCHSAFEGVEQLPAGGWLKFSADGRSQSGRYWNLPGVSTDPVDPGTVRDVLDGAIALRAAPERTAAIFLSGGLDSAIVAASLHKQVPEQDLHCFSIGYDIDSDEDETLKARRLAKALDTRHDVLQLTAEEVPGLLADVAKLTEDPNQDPMTISTLKLARAVAQETKVVLTGDGSDEVWRGYCRMQSPPARLPDYLPRMSIFQPEDLGLADFPESYFDGVPFAPETMAMRDRIHRLEVANRMRNYHLSRIDKITMGCGLEARCPFVDIRVVSLGLSIPGDVKCAGGKPKQLLASEYADLLPRWLIERKKQPFSLPIGAWLLGPLHDYARDLLLAPNAFTRSYVDALPLFNALEDGRANSHLLAHKLWSLLQLEVWSKAVLAPMAVPQEAGATFQTARNQTVHAA